MIINYVQIKISVYIFDKACKVEQYNADRVIYFVLRCLLRDRLFHSILNLFYIHHCSVSVVLLVSIHHDPKYFSGSLLAPFTSSKVCPTDSYTGSSSLLAGFKLRPNLALPHRMRARKSPLLNFI